MQAWIVTFLLLIGSLKAGAQTFGDFHDLSFLADEPAATSSFSPTNLTNLKLWLKADAITGKVDGDALSQWDDSSGQANHATMSTATNQPIYKTSIINGQPVVRFDGQGDRMDLPNFVSAFTEAQIFIVFKVVNDPSQAITSHGSGGLWKFSEVDNSHVPYTDGTCYEAFGTTVRKTMGNPTPSLATTFRVYSVRTKASEWTSWLDGVQLYDTASNTVAFSTTPNIGQGKTSAVNLYGDIAEVILYSTALTSTDRQSVEQYLSAKYGLGL